MNKNRVKVIVHNTRFLISPHYTLDIKGRMEGSRRERGANGIKEIILTYYCGPIQNSMK